MKNYNKNLKLLTKNHVYSKEMEHDACGVDAMMNICKLIDISLMDSQIPNPRISL